MMSKSLACWSHGQHDVLDTASIRCISWRYRAAIVYNPRGAAISMDASLKANIYSDVLRKIVAGHFAAGDHLGEEELALTYHVSRTPIREILFLLQKDG